MLSWLIGWADAACTFDAHVADLDRAVGEAEAAYISLDVGEFERASTAVDFVLPCLDERVDAVLAARLHRLRGLGRFVDGDTDGARAALLGAKALEPAYVFPEDVLPTGYELRTIYETLPPPPDEARRLPRPRGGDLVFDGAPARERPLGRSVVFQRTEAGAVVDTRYLAPDDETPSYPGANKRDTAIAATGVGAAVAGGVLYALAWSSRAALPDSRDEDALLAGQRRTNVLTAAGVVLVGAGAAGVAVGVSGSLP